MTQWIVVNQMMAMKILIKWRKCIQNDFFLSNPQLSKIKWDASIIYALYSHFKAKQQTEMVVLIDDNKSGIDQIAAIVVYANKYNCFCEPDYRPHKFIWYIMKNPRVDTKNIFGSFLSFQYKKSDYVWLHADPEGGEKLLQYYNKYGFERCQCKYYQNVTLSRRFDGRYLYKLFT